MLDILNQTITYFDGITFQVNSSSAFNISGETSQVMNDFTASQGRVVIYNLTLDSGVIDSESFLTVFSPSLGLSTTIPFVIQSCPHGLDDQQVPGDISKSFCVPTKIFVTAYICTGIAGFLLIISCLFLCIFSRYNVKKPRYLMIGLDDTTGINNFEFSRDLYEIDFDDLQDLKELSVGKGSAAIVFKARWKNERVAVKLFRTSFFQNENDFAEFEHELKLISTLKHSVWFFHNNINALEYCFLLWCLFEKPKDRDRHRIL